MERDRALPPLPPAAAAAAAAAGAHAAQAANGRHTAAWHALEIQSSEDGSSHAVELKLAAAAAALHATDPTERLLPKPEPVVAARQRQPGVDAGPGMLPVGISRRQRLVMVTLFSLTAALLYAGVAPGALAASFSPARHRLHCLPAELCIGGPGILVAPLPWIPTNCCPHMYRPKPHGAKPHCNCSRCDGQLGAAVAGCMLASAAVQATGPADPFNLPSPLGSLVQCWFVSLSPLPLQTSTLTRSRRTACWEGSLLPPFILLVGALPAVAAPPDRHRSRAAIRAKQQSRAAAVLAGNVGTAAPSQHGMLRTLGMLCPLCLR